MCGDNSDRPSDTHSLTIFVRTVNAQKGLRSMRRLTAVPSTIVIPSWSRGPRSCDVRAARLHIDRVERLAAGHEESVALAPAEAYVGADLGQADLTDANAVGRKDVHAVIAVADPAGARPDIAVLVAADAVREARLAVELHARESARVLQLVAVHVVGPDDVLSFRIVGSAGIGDVKPAIVVAEAQPVGLERLVGDLGDVAALVDAIDCFLAQR